MAKNWLFIENGIVVDIINQDDAPTSEQTDKTFDTVAQDDSQTFKIGDAFTAELQLQYNTTIWEANGWIPTPEQIATEQAKQKAIQAAIQSVKVS